MIDPIVEVMEVLNIVKFKPVQSFYWTYDKKYYFESNTQYLIPLQLYNQVKHYEYKQNENNC